ncbi:Transcription factor bhlh42 [Sarracenia purpurea var. burkii]
MAGDLICSSQSAFSDWTIRSADHHILPISAEDTSQWVLKYILFTVPFLHAKYSDENSPRSRNAAESASRFRKGTPQDELNANHVLAERRRREKLNERFITLRSLVPFVTRMDKASILGDTIEYLKQLRTKIEDLEARENQMEVDQQWSRSLSGVTAVVDRARLGGVPPGSDKRKVRIVEETGVAKPRAVDSPSPPHPVAGVTVQVSIIESNALVELECAQREGLLLDVMVVLRELQVEVTAVQSSFTNGVMVAELKAKVKENVEGKKANIVEVKRAIHQIIPPALTPLQ